VVRKYSQQVVVVVINGDEHPMLNKIVQKSPTKQTKASGWAFYET